MKESVCSTKIDECTEIGQIFYSTLYNISNVDSCEKLLFQLCLLSNQKLLSVTDDSSLLRIELSYNKFNLLSVVLGKILLIRIRYKTCRDEDFCLINNYT